MDKSSYLIDLSESSKSDFGKREFREQSRAQKVFSAIWELESQVNNGGFVQYFTNRWGEPSIDFTPEALRAVGANEYAKLVERARKLVPKNIPEDFDERSDFLDELDEKLRAKFEALDGAYYNRPEDLTELLFTFVAAHPKEFGPIPNS